MIPLLALPNYGQPLDPRQDPRVLGAKRYVKDFDVRTLTSSFLTYCFNFLWCFALNGDYSHFVLLHADIAPKQDNWLAMLIEVCDGAGADIMSVVVPLKTEDGLTSTALSRGDEYGDFRRATLTELRELPATFGKRKVAELFGWEARESTLLVNTGCMVVNMRHKDKLAKMRFTTNNWIRRKSGKYVAVSEPEDWDWSRQAQQHGLQVWATKVIPVSHAGYDSDRVWGREHDAGDSHG